MNVGLWYSFKAWILTGLMSFVLSQIPLLYLYHTKFSLRGDSYSGLTTQVFFETLEAMCFIIIPWVVIVPFVKRLYKPEWTIGKYRLVLLFIAEFLVLFFLLDGIIFFTTSLVLPMGIMLLVFAGGTAVAICMCKVGPLVAELYRQRKLLE